MRCKPVPAFEMERFEVRHFVYTLNIPSQSEHIHPVLDEVPVLAFEMERFEVRHFVCTLEVHHFVCTLT